MQTAKILLLVPEGMNTLTAALECKDVCKIMKKYIKKLKIDQHMHIRFRKPSKQTHLEIGAA